MDAYHGAKLVEKPVVPEIDDLVQPTARATPVPMQPHAARVRRQVLVVGGDHPAGTRRHHFRRVERETTGESECASLDAAKRRSVGVGAVLDEREPAF